MDKQIVYILSTNYAGSHFLALQLGSHSHCTSIGELHHFRRKNTAKKMCYLCENDESCPIFSGIKGQPVKGFYNTIFDNLAGFDSNITTVIDNSKKVRWARRFIKMPGYTKKYIHLIRDPRALVRRWMITFDESTKKLIRLKTARRCWHHAWNIMTSDEANVYTWNWLYQNQQISNFIKSNNLDAQTVTYHDLVFKTDSVLSKLMNWLGYDYELSQKDYWNFIHHSTVKPSYMKKPTNDQKIFDQRWRSFLDEHIQQTISCDPNINSYLESIGASYDDLRGLLKE